MVKLTTYILIFSSAIQPNYFRNEKISLVIDSLGKAHLMVRLAFVPFQFPSPVAGRVLHFCNAPFWHQSLDDNVLSYQPDITIETSITSRSRF